MEMVANWDSTTFGQLMRGMKNQPHWPEELAWKLLEAVKAQPPCHRFLREYFMAAPPGRTWRMLRHSWQNCPSGWRSWTQNSTPDLASAFPTSAPLRQHDFEQGQR